MEKKTDHFIKKLKHFHYEHILPKLLQAYLLYRLAWHSRNFGFEELKNIVYPVPF
jgi:hypothetical protein